jgi:hypothetical protein
MKQVTAIILSQALGRSLKMSKIKYPPVGCVSESPIAVDVFLAGSIEMGLAVDWQDDVGTSLTAVECVGYVFNPRRKDWNADAVQNINSEYFANQVNWELDSIEEADVIFMYFDPATKSPISLAELGYILGAISLVPRDLNHLTPTLVVCCPDGFWRQGNVEIMCARQGIKMIRDFDEAKTTLEIEVWKKHRAYANYYGYYPFQCPWESQSEKMVPLDIRGTRIDFTKTFSNK